MNWLRRIWKREERSPADASLLSRGWFEDWLRRSDFVGHYPSYVGLLSRLDPVATTQIEVMAVALSRWDAPDGTLQLLVNLEYFEEHPEYFAGVLHHELRHVVLGHLSDASLHRCRYPEVMELAMELSANESISDPLPPGLFIEDYRELGIEEGQSTFQRYALLRAAWEDGRLQRLPRRGKYIDAHRPSSMHGGAGLGDLLDSRREEPSRDAWLSARWGLGPPTHPQALAEMQTRIAAHLRGERGGQALEQGGLRVAKELDRVIIVGARGDLNWRALLREAFPQSRTPHADYRRPARRFQDRLGEIPGRIRRSPKLSLLVAVDTSASMSTDVLGAIGSEIERLGRHARVTVAEVDAAVHRIYPARGRIGPLRGGGDTDLELVFTHAARFDGLVYFTDGHGPMAAHSRVPTLWVVPHHEPFGAAFGTVARLFER